MNNSIKGMIIHPSYSSKLEDDRISKVPKAVLRADSLLMLKITFLDI